MEDGEEEEILFEEELIEDNQQGYSHVNSEIIFFNCLTIISTRSSRRIFLLSFSTVIADCRHFLGGIACECSI